jgi:hypothetical protein
LLEGGEKVFAVLLIRGLLLCRGQGLRGSVGFTVGVQQGLRNSDLGFRVMVFEIMV